MQRRISEKNFYVAKMNFALQQQQQAQRLAQTRQAALPIASPKLNRVSRRQERAATQQRCRSQSDSKPTEYLNILTPDMGKRARTQRGFCSRGIVARLLPCARSLLLSAFTPNALLPS